MSGNAEEAIPLLKSRIQEGYQLRQEGRVGEAREIFLAL